MISLWIACLMGLLTLFIYAKAIVWWLVFGVLRRVFGFIRRSEFVQMTSRGLNYGVGILVVDIALCVLAMVGGWVTGLTVLLSTGLCLAVFLSELLTLGGVLRGDWNPSSPCFRVFGLSGPCDSRTVEYDFKPKTSQASSGGWFSAGEWNRRDIAGYYYDRDCNGIKC